MKLARILADTIVEFITIPEDAPSSVTVVGEHGELEMRPTVLADCFHPDFLASLVSVPDDAQIGWVKVEGSYEPPPAAEPEGPALLPITRRQLRLTLLAHGLLGQVEPAIAALDEPARSVATIEWQDASEYRRDHALIGQIGAALDLDQPAIDAMWIEAMAR